MAIRRFSTSARPSRMLRVSEMFASIQGEGPWTGRPSLFLRLGLCNLECTWCDTKYTWLHDQKTLDRVRAHTPPELHSMVGETFFDKKKELRKMSIPDAIAEIREKSGSGIRTVVLTGGEPLLHKELFPELITSLHALGFNVEMETNGTLSARGLPVGVHYNVSPKLSNSHQAPTRIKDKILSEFLEDGAVFKFVVVTDEDVKEVQDIVDRVGIPPEKVFLMPEGTSTDAIDSKALSVVDLCVQRGFRYSHRLHVALWGSKRGV